MQGRMQATADELGEHYAPGETKRFENMTSSINSVTEITTAGEAGKTQTIISGGRQTLDTHREVRAYDREDWRTSK
jgi:hypothetical protein